jgi:molecular chaperone GrpE (heat shock protein)
LETQAHLLEREGKPVAARDVLTVAKRLIRALEDEGLTLEGKTGETVAFDPNYHQPLEVGPGLTPGQPVVIRSPGISYAGRVLHRAGVRKGGS